MTDNFSLVSAYPEIFLLVASCVIALVGLGAKTSARGLTHFLTLATLAGVAVMLALRASSGMDIVGFGGLVVSDPMGNWLKCFAAVAMLVTLVYGRTYAGHRDMMRGSEMYTLALYALLGMFVMISGHNFLVIYLGLELLTLSSYALVALRRDDLNATEAAMKYFVLGALASGFLLYGLSMVYGATGSLDLSGVMQAIAGGEETLKGSPPGAGAGSGFCGGRSGLQAGCGAVPHVGARRVPRSPHGGDADDRWRPQAGGICHRDPLAGRGPDAVGCGLAADAGGAVGDVVAGG